MKTIYEHIKDIQDEYRMKLKNQLEKIKKSTEKFEMSYKSNPSNNRHPQDRIRKLEVELESDIIDNIFGWDYVEDVCYLDEVELSNLRSARKEIAFPYDDVFERLNKIVYLELEIDHLNLTQKNVRRDRAEKPPIDEIIRILDFYPTENEVVIPLVNLLASLDGDHTHRIIDYDQRIQYTIAKEQSQKRLPPSLNIDRLAKLKDNYKEEIDLLYDVMRTHNPRNYKKTTKTLLEAIKIPLKPSSI